MSTNIWSPSNASSLWGSASRTTNDRACTSASPRRLSLHTSKGALASGDTRRATATAALRPDPLWLRSSSPAVESISSALTRSRTEVPTRSAPPPMPSSISSGLAQIVHRSSSTTNTPTGLPLRSRRAASKRQWSSASTSAATWRTAVRDTLWPRTSPTWTP
ncbi:MAG TPA: hypothetical protein PKE56_06280 [Acidimicrobiales bacterium]|nr:hypothetical protein [Acidimicrobiales bacterium]